MIRHEKGHIETAKKDRAVLYSLEINRKYTIPSDLGGSFSRRGVCSVKDLPVLMFTQRVLGYGVPVEEAIEVLRQEFKVAMEPASDAAVTKEDVVRSRPLQPSTFHFGVSGDPCSYWKSTGGHVVANGECRCGKRFILSEQDVSPSL